MCHKLPCFRESSSPVWMRAIFLSGPIQILASPHTFIYISFYFLLGRCTYDLVVRWWGFAYLVSVYCNSLLATLNVRKVIRGKGHSDNGISLYPVDGSNGSASGNRQVDEFASHSYYTVSHPISNLGNRHQDRNCEM